MGTRADGFPCAVRSFCKTRCTPSGILPRCFHVSRVERLTCASRSFSETQCTLRGFCRSFPPWTALLDIGIYSRCIINYLVTQKTIFRKAHLWVSRILQSRHPACFSECALMSFSETECLPAITGSKFAPSGLTEQKWAVARNEMCSSLIFMQKDNPGIFKPRD